MKFSWIQKTATYALAGVAAYPLFSSGEVGIEWVVLTALLGLAGWWAEPPLTRRKKYRRGVTALAAAVLLLQIGRSVTGVPVVRTGMEFTAFLLGIKFVTRGFASDYSQIVILSFMHIIAATIAVDDLSYAAAFLIFACLSPPVLSMAYLRKEMENRFGRDKRDTTKNLLERLLNSKRIVSYRFVLGSFFLSLPILVITAVLFITFPRMGFGFFGRLSSDVTQAGFGPEVELGDLDVTRLDETVLIRLEPFGFEQKMPDRIAIKIRGAVFDTYRNNTWKKHRTPLWREMPSHSGLYRLDPRASARSDSRGFTVFLNSIHPPLLFLPEGTGIITTSHVFPNRRPRQGKLEQNVHGSIRYDDRGKVGIRYKTYLTQYPPIGPPPRQVNEYLSMPPESDRISALAREFAGNGEKVERVRNILRALKHNYTYSLRLSSSPANELATTPLERFLFTRRTGTCEHFATAMTLMSRAVGVPSRLATGFSAAEWNPIGEYYAVKSRFAHAWTEVYLNGRWITVDATPPSTETTEDTTPSAIAMFIDALKMQWHKRVVGYDASSQFEMAVGLWNFLRRHSIRDRKAPSHLLWPLAVLLGVTGMGIGAYYFVLKRKRRIGQSRTKQRPLDRDERDATKLYMTLERKLVSNGHPRKTHRTPLEHVADLQRQGYPAAKTIGSIVRRYNDIRFGRDRFEDGELARLRTQIRGL